MDGFYAVYMTGRGGNSIALLAIHLNKVTGVDIGGVKYDGTVETLPNGSYRFHIRYTIPPGTSLITGMGSVATPTPVSLDFHVPADFEAGTIIAIQTPLGPVNAKMTKLREFNLNAEAG